VGGVVMRKYRFVPVVLAILSLGVSMAYEILTNNLPNFEDIPWGIWAFIGFIFIQTVVLIWDNWRINNSKPLIKLKDFDFEVKHLAKNMPWAVCAYIDVYNEPKDYAINDVNAYGVYPTITWIEKHTGDIKDENNGRWFYADEDKKNLGANKLLKADLEASGEPRRLHFTYSTTQSFALESLWRTPDNKNETKKRMSETGYDITILLRSNNGGEEKLYFYITPTTTEAWPFAALRCARLDEKTNEEVSVKYYDLKNLHDWEKQHPIDKE
jgi:hypothetical protein